MKLTTTTLEFLKNFATIQPNIVVKSGSTISTIAESNNILAVADVSEFFPQTFGIYDLNKFLSALSLMDDPDLVFGDHSVEIKGDRSSLEFFYADSSVLKAPTKTITMPTADVTITLDAETIASIKKASSVLGHATLAITGKDGVITISIFDPKVSTANKFTVTVDDENSCQNNFSFVLSIGNLKMIPGKYTVSLSSKNISHFKNEDAPVQYWIALERESTFSK